MKSWQLRSSVSPSSRPETRFRTPQSLEWEPGKDWRDETHAYSATRAAHFGTRLPHRSLALTDHRSILLATRYLLLCELQGDRVIVYAVVHPKRQPGFWKKR
jgi:hypothetical protein